MRPTTESAHAAAAPPVIGPGSVRRFGRFGVLYEILRPLDDESFLIRVLDTGEELAYSRAKVLADPRD